MSYLSPINNVLQRKHEQVCEKWQKRREKTPTSDDDDGTNTFHFSDSPQAKRKDWYKQHDDLLNDVYNSRKSKKTYTEQPFMSRSSSPEDEGLYSVFKYRTAHGER